MAKCCPKPISTLILQEVITTTEEEPTEDNFELREDGGFELREDGGFELRESGN